MWGELPAPIRWIPLPLSPAAKTAGCSGLRVKTRVAPAPAGTSSAQARPSSADRAPRSGSSPSADAIPPGAPQGSGARYRRESGLLRPDRGCSGCVARDRARQPRAEPGEEPDRDHDPEPVQADEDEQGAGDAARIALASTGSVGRPTTRAVNQAQRSQTRGPLTQPQVVKKECGRSRPRINERTATAASWTTATRQRISESTARIFPPAGGPAGQAAGVPSAAALSAARSIFRIPSIAFIARSAGWNDYREDL